jgi:hypothetical protein
MSEGGEYRAYVIGPDGHFMNWTGLICPNDEAAIDAAKQLVDGHEVELWSGDRLVATLKSGNPNAE